MRTPLPTINATRSDNTDITPKSLMDYGSDYNFQMSVDFDFTGANYVNANHSKNPHRSFHCNSGVKIYNLYEIQIYDTASLLSESPLETMQNGVQKTNWQNVQVPSNGIKKSGDTSFESISGCVTNIPYLANTWHTKSQSDLTNVTNRKSLIFTFSLDDYNVTIENEVFPCNFGTGNQYKTSLSSNMFDRKIYLQNHWGSGVSFKKITINKQ